MLHSMNPSLTLPDLCAIKDTVAAITQLENRLFKETGLNLNQSFALCCLARGPLTAGALAEQLKISGPSLSRIIRKLVGTGLIVRDLSLKDARNRSLFLSPGGMAKASELLATESRLFPWPIQYTQAL